MTEKFETASMIILTYSTCKMLTNLVAPLATEVHILQSVEIKLVDTIRAHTIRQIISGYSMGLTNSFQPWLIPSKMISH